MIRNIVRYSTSCMKKANAKRNHINGAEKTNNEITREAKITSNNSA